MNTASKTQWEDFDPFASLVRENPYPHLAALRDHAPCVHLRCYNVWFVTRYADVSRVLDDWKTFSSRQGAGLVPIDNPLEAGLIIAIDPPEHTRIRRVVSRDISPKVVNALEPRVRELAASLISAASRADSIDWVTYLAQPLPTRVYAELLGYPKHRDHDYCSWAMKMFDILGPVGATASNAAAAAWQEMFGHVNDLTTNDGYTSGSWAQGICHAGRTGEITPEESLSLLGGTIVAAMETTVHLLANTMNQLIDEPAAWDQLKANPSLAASVIEEALRYDAPVQPGLFRLTTSDVDIAGTTVPMGSRIMVGFGAANRDERQFPDPDSFIVDRDPNQHLSFGRGVHFCAGAGAVRLVGRVVLEELVSQVSTIERSGPARRKDTLMVRGFDALPIRLRAR